MSEKLSVAMHKRNEDDDVEKSSTGTDRDEVRKARSQFKNLLEFTTVAMQDSFVCFHRCSLFFNSLWQLHFFCFHLNTYFEGPRIVAHFLRDNHCLGSTPRMAWQSK